MRKAIVSACLLGELCRYDGKLKRSSEVISSLEDYEVIPFCPEAPIFGTPRERINIVRINNKNQIITDQTQKDVTHLLYQEILSFTKEYPKADKIILKSKSPSCGYKTTPILDQEKNILTYGNGLAADIFTQKYPTIKIEDENRYQA